MTYTEKVLKRFYIDQAHSWSSHMVVRPLDVGKNPFCPGENKEEIRDPEVPYLSVSHTRPGIIIFGKFFGKVCRQFLIFIEECIVMELNIYFVISRIQKIWDYYFLTCPKKT